MTFAYYSILHYHLLYTLACLLACCVELVYSSNFRSFYNQTSDLKSVSLFFERECIDFLSRSKSRNLIFIMNIPCLDRNEYYNPIRIYIPKTNICSYGINELLLKIIDNRCKIRNFKNVQTIVFKLGYVMVLIL